MRSCGSLARSGSVNDDKGAISPPLSIPLCSFSLLSPFSILLIVNKKPAESRLLERGYNIIPAAKVKRTADEAIKSGMFVHGYEDLMNWSNAWKKECVHGEIFKEFYHRTKENPSGEYARAVAVFDGGKIWDFYVINADGDEI